MHALLGRERRVQAWLRWMVLGCMLPTLAMAVFLIMQGYLAQRADLEQGAVATARALMQAVDRELAGVQALLAILAAAPELQAGDLAGFHARIAPLLPAVTFSNLVLADPDGRQLLNTLRPFGSALPGHANPDLVRAASEGGRAVISDLYIGGRAGQPLIGLAAPVMLRGRVAYVLTVGIYPERLVEMLRQQNLPRGWYASLLDVSGTIIARSSGHEPLVGQRASDGFRARIAASREGVTDTISRTGEAVFAGFSRSDRSGWTMVIGIPRAEVISGLQASLRLGIGVAGGLILLSVVWAGGIGGRIGRAIESLKGPALALAANQHPELPRSTVAEVNEVGQALTRTWELLERRSMERTRAEAEQVEALRRLHERSAELERLNAEIEQFAYVTAHDLKSPLGAIAHLADWIEQDAPGGPGAEMDANLALLRGRVERMQSLLDGLLAYAQVGRDPAAPERVDTAALVATILAAAPPPAGFAVACQGPMPVLHTERQALGDVLAILIANAIQHHDRGEGRIEVSASVEGRHVEFRVLDDGPGIAPRFHARIFGIFQTLRSRDELESAGVGLAIARKRVVAHGGRIWVESLPPARGACFVFTWQAALAEAPPSLPS